MLRLYQRLQRWASLLHGPPSSIPGQGSIRRVVTVEWEEREVLLRPASRQPTPGERTGAEEFPTKPVATSEATAPGQPEGQRSRPKDIA